MPSGEKRKVPLDVPRDEHKDEKESAEKRDAEKEELKKLQQRSMRDTEKDEPADEMSEEDRKLKEDLEMMVQRVTEIPSTSELRNAALEHLRSTIRSSTSSMTSVPKPLKFLRPHYDTLKSFYEKPEADAVKQLLADVLSVLAMTMAKEGTRESLHFKLQGFREELGSWGHEYVRHLAGEIGQEYEERAQKAGEAKAQAAHTDMVIEPPDNSDLVALVDGIIPFNMTHNAEADACDLLMEVDRIAYVVGFVNKDNHSRVCLYLAGCADFMPEDEDKQKLLEVVFESYMAGEALPDALRFALKTDSEERVQAVFQAAKEQPRDVMLQLGFILSETKSPYVARVSEEFADDEQLTEIIGGCHASRLFHDLARELDVQEAKTPEDIYKSHLSESSSVQMQRGGSNAAAGPVRVDSAKQNLASSFVNAFVNAGFGKDLLVTPEGADWLYKNKEHGMLSATASLGMILLWDLESGFSGIDKYSFSAQPYVKAGSLLASGIVSTGITSDLDASFALLSEFLGDENVNMRLAAVLGLGISYAGSAREDVLDALSPLAAENEPLEVAALAALSLGLVFVGTCHEGLSGSLIEVLLERGEKDLDDPAARMLALGLGLLYLGQGDTVEAPLETIGVLEHDLAPYVRQTLEACAYCGTGNVLAVQKMLSVVGEHIEDEKKNAHQGMAALGLALATVGEEIGSSMMLRSLDHVLQYGEVNVRRAVPLALALLSLCNPQMTVMDTLSKLTHDQDETISQNAILGLGFIGAGTNNSRIASLLRQLADYYAKETNHLFLIRIAQGLLHMGKGLMTLHPFYSDHALMNKAAMAGIVVVLASCLDAKNTILSKRHYLLFCLCCAIRPRMLMTLDENLQHVAVKVRVGQAVDTVGQAGRPKTITGFQTHTTPVLLSHGERAELATDEYLALSTVLEGVVIVKKNPDASTEATD